MKKTRYITGTTLLKMRMRMRMCMDMCMDFDMSSSHPISILKSALSAV